MLVLALERKLMIYDAVSEHHMGMEQLIMLAINCHPFCLIIKQLYMCTTHGTRCRLGSIQNLDSEGRSTSDQHLKATPGKTGRWRAEWRRNGFRENSPIICCMGHAGVFSMLSL